MGPRRLMSFVVWWLVLLGLYVALISTLSIAELVVGALVAAIAAAVALLTARAFDVDATLPAFRWRWLLSFPVDAGIDVARLTRRVVSCLPGRRTTAGWWDTAELPDDAGPTEAVRAYAVLVVSLTPASYVVDVHVDDESDDAGVLQIHRWAKKGPVERAVTP